MCVRTCVCKGCGELCTHHTCICAFFEISPSLARSLCHTLPLPLPIPLPLPLSQPLPPLFCLFSSLSLFLTNAHTQSLPLLSLLMSELSLSLSRARFPSLALSVPPFLFFSPSLSLSHALSLSRSLSHAFSSHTHTDSLSCRRARARSLSLSLSRLLSGLLSRALSLCLFPHSLSLTNTSRPPTPFSLPPRTPSLLLSLQEDSCPDVTGDP